MTSSTKFLDHGLNRLAYEQIAGVAPGVMFCGGFMSDMTGTKATALAGHCMEQNRAFVRFDYSGHGASGGRFEDGCISQWRDDALTVLDTLTEGPQVLVGSSMGGWIALLLALARPERIRGLVLLAPAPDFTQALSEHELTAPEQASLTRDGRIERPSQYSQQPYVITHHLVQDGKQHLLLQAPIAVTCPVRVLQGMRDTDVPWERALILVDRLTSDDVTLTLLKNGDHRLSNADDLDRLTAAVTELCQA
ncbi:alpha/beta hydrolase [Immundisolibacter sp.]|uniref:alpha/beta hydrolase n=1 Tax=Immundisolibacter sp. TaxID=1934948 RepID=UPI0035620AEA